MNMYFMYRSKLSNQFILTVHWISCGEAVLPDQLKVWKPVMAAWICTWNIHFLERPRLLLPAYCHLNMFHIFHILSIPLCNNKPNHYNYINTKNPLYSVCYNCPLGHKRTSLGYSSIDTKQSKAEQVRIR